MRIWFIHPKYYDKKGILAQWNEGLILRNMIYGSRNPITIQKILEQEKKTKSKSKMNTDEDYLLLLSKSKSKKMMETPKTAKSSKSVEKVIKGKEKTSKKSNKTISEVDSEEYEKINSKSKRDNSKKQSKSLSKSKSKKVNKKEESQDDDSSFSPEEESESKEEKEGKSKSKKSSISKKDFDRLSVKSKKPAWSNHPFGKRVTRYHFSLQKKIINTYLNFLKEYGKEYFGINFNEKYLDYDEIDSKLKIPILYEHIKKDRDDALEKMEVRDKDILKIVQKEKTIEKFELNEPFYLETDFTKYLDSLNDEYFEFCEGKIYKFIGTEIPMEGEYFQEVLKRYDFDNTMKKYKQKNFNEKDYLWGVPSTSIKSTQNESKSDKTEKKRESKSSISKSKTKSKSKSKTKIENNEEEEISNDINSPIKNMSKHKLEKKDNKSNNSKKNFTTSKLGDFSLIAKRKATPKKNKK